MDMKNAYALCVAKKFKYATSTSTIKTYIVDADAKVGEDIDIVAKREFKKLHLDDTMMLFHYVRLGPVTIK